MPWIPLFIFVFLFGLSMDYHVFILSRIRELRTGGAGPGSSTGLLRTRDAVVNGIASSAGVVTSAAVIMVAVFSIFATLHLIQLKMLGLGLAVAVLIDATVVRGILLPACLALLGERTWYLPRWLAWLPGGGAAAGAPVPAGPARGSRLSRNRGPCAEPRASRSGCPAGPGHRPRCRPARRGQGLPPGPPLPPSPLRARAAMPGTAAAGYGRPGPGPDSGHRDRAARDHWPGSPLPERFLRGCA